MKNLTRKLTLAAALGGLFTLSTSAADWPQWRGTDNSDHSPDKGLLKSWPAEGPKRVWLNTDVGLGYSGYSIVGGKLFTMGLRNDTEFLIAVDANTGKELWATKIGERLQNRWGDGPRGTPSVDGNLVYALGGQGDLICANIADGRQVWSVSLPKDLGGKVQGWGYTSSPLIDGDALICVPGGSKGTLAALDKATGKLKWQSTEFTDDAHYSTPIVFNHGSKRQYAMLVEKRLFGVDAATGKSLWSSDWPGRTAVIPTPIFDAGQVYVTTGYGVGSKLVQLDGKGGATDVWENKVMKNHHGGVIKVGAHLYGYSDGPGWICQDWKTGEEVWADKSLGKGAIHFADGMFYCLDESRGTVALIEASSSGWKEHGRFTLDPQTTKRSSQGRIWTHPVVINGKLYLRDQELLYCYDVKGN